MPISDKLIDQLLEGCPSREDILGGSSLLKQLTKKVAERALEAEQALNDFAEKWDDQYPTISQSWRNHWERLSVFFDYPPQIRKVIYTTNAIESLNALAGQRLAQDASQRSVHAKLHS